MSTKLTSKEIEKELTKKQREKAKAELLKRQSNKDKEVKK